MECRGEIADVIISKQVKSQESSANESQDEDNQQPSDVQETCKDLINLRLK